MTEEYKSHPNPQADKKDIEDNKVLAVISYLPPLCLVPLLLKKDSPYAKFHGIQGLVLLIAWIASSAIMIIPILGWIAGFVGYVACTILTIVGLINSWQGEMKELPWIGKYAKSLNL